MLWAFKITGVTILEILRFPTWESTWESWDKMTFECQSYGQAQKILQGVVASPKFELW